MTEQSKEYATALFLLAEETKESERFGKALQRMQAVFAENPAYVEFLSCPGIPKDERTAALAEAFSGEEDFPIHVLSFVQILVERGRIREFDDCVSQFEVLRLTLQKLSKATVRSAVALSEEEKIRLNTALQKQSGHAILAQYEVDPALLGGLSVEIDGKVLDGTLRHRLHQVKEVIDR